MIKAQDKPETDIQTIEKFEKTQVNPEKIAKYLGAEFSQDKTSDILCYKLEFKENNQLRIKLYFSEDKDTLHAFSGIRDEKADTFVTFSYITKVLFQTFKIVSKAKKKQDVEVRKTITIFTQNETSLMITDQFMLAVTGPCVESECSP